jgi:hypothetical protein
MGPSHISSLQAEKRLVADTDYLSDTFFRFIERKRCEYISRLVERCRGKRNFRIGENLLCKLRLVEKFSLSDAL